MLIGYARKNSIEGLDDEQIMLLKAVGCDVLYEDVVTPSEMAQPQLAELISRVSAADTLVICRVAVLAFSTRKLSEIVQLILSKQCSLHVVEQGIQIDCSPDLARLFDAIANVDAALHREKIKLGMKRSESTGKGIGRPRKLTAGDIIAMKEIIEESDLSIKEAASNLGVKLSTLQNNARKLGIKLKDWKS